MLVARGVLKEVPGKGTFVWQNVSEPLKDLLNIFAAGRGPSAHRHLFEVRSLLEVEIAGLAAERATSEDICTLNRINDKLARMAKKNRIEEIWPQDKLRTYNQLELEFHMGLARCTKNEFFVILLGALAEAISESWAHIHDRSETRVQGVDLHANILAAISARDPRAARRAARENLKAFLDAGREEQGAQTGKEGKHRRLGPPPEGEHE
jgi:DNA-binding FadR family transcriptional regulator